MTVKKRLKQITTSLIDYVELLEQTFNQNEEVSIQSRSAFEYVKKETEPIFSTLENWEKLTIAEINKGQLMMPITIIESTVDNMKAFIMHSYYKDVRKRRYMEIKRSILYVFRLLLKELNDGT